VSGIIRQCCPDICFVSLSYFFIYLLVIMQSIMPQLFPQNKLASANERFNLSAESKVMLPQSWLLATGYCTVRNSTSSLPHSTSSWHQSNYIILPSTLLSSKRSLPVRCVNRRWLQIYKPTRPARVSFPPRRL
jgi:hypothetical protein